jgi:hypothetical protein
MRYNKSIYVFLLLQLQLSTNGLHGQQMPLQTFSLAGDHYVAAHLDGLQLDWRLDLGLTSINLDKSNSYQFTAGFLQPTINRFTNDGIWEKDNPSIELKNTFNRNVIVLYSKEPDLVLFGFKIFNLHGQLLALDQNKYKSSYAGRSINIHAMASGVYIMQVFYLPEQMAFDINTIYWMKTLKFIKL